MIGGVCGVIGGVCGVIGGCIVGRGVIGGVYSWEGCDGWGV